MKPIQAEGKRSILGARERLLLIRVGLVPVDWLLHIVGPKYTLFYWFFRIAPPALVAWVGKLRAIRALDHAVRRVPAYRDFASSLSVTNRDVSTFRVPPTDKRNYIDAFPMHSRCLGGSLPTANTAIDESSGSSGNPYNWIRSIEERHVSHVFISHFARYGFGTGPWITINAFSMGAWATGVNMGIALQRNSIVKNTGPDLDKIFSTMRYLGSDMRYLICGYPPFLKHMIDQAHADGFPLEQYDLMALLGGEGNSEGLRDYLSQYFGPVYSGYGATDVEIGIAGETPISVAIRREARHDDRLKIALFGSDSRLPMVFQYNPLMHLIEVNELGELMFTITRLNVLSPRVMYNIHDEGGVATFAEMESTFRSVGYDLEGLLPETEASAFKLPFLWIFGRKDSTVSVMGANIYPEDLEQCLYDEPELAKVTRSFCLGLQEGEGGAVRPQFSFEISGEITSSLEERFEERIVARLAALNADYRESMQEYADTVTPIIQLYHLGEGPFGADASKIKQTRVLRP